MTFKVTPGNGASELHLGMSRADIVALLGEPAVERMTDGGDRLSWPDRGIAVILKSGAATRIWFGEATGATCGPLKMLTARADLSSKFTGVAEVRETDDWVAYDVAGLCAFLLRDGDSRPGQLLLRGYLVLPREEGHTQRPGPELPDSADGAHVPEVSDVNIGGGGGSGRGLEPLDDDGIEEAEGVAPPPDLQGDETLTDMPAGVEAMAVQGAAAEGSHVGGVRLPPPPPPPPSRTEVRKQLGDAAVPMRTVDAPEQPDTEDRRPMPKGGALPINYLFVIDPGHGDDRVYLGLDVPAIEANLGEPMGQRKHTLRFPGRGMVVRLDDEGIVRAITWCNEKSPLFLGPIRPAWVEVNGLRLGDPSSRIRECVPEAEKQDDSLESETNCYVLPGCEIHHVRGEVVQLTVYSRSGRPTLLDDE